MSRIDQLYRRLLLTKFFTKGWGKPDNLRRLFEFRKILSNRETCQNLVASNYPIHIDKEYKDGDCCILEGHFPSPFIDHLPGIMPKEVEMASFQMILPLQWRHPSLKPVCIHLAGTGDHYFWRRRLLTARPLLKEAGIASIILENPYYGSRKPKSQLRSSLHNVSDLFVMGGALVLESLALLHWCEREGWGPLGISGISMGGHMASSAATAWPRPLSLIPILSWTTASTCFTQMASLAATNWTKPLSLIPCLSWSTASQVFTQGVMSGAIPWDTLQEQFFENSIYHDEISKLIESPERSKGNAYNMGKQFVQNYSQDASQMAKYHLESLHVKPEQLPGHPYTATQLATDSSSSDTKSKNTISLDRNNSAVKNAHYATITSPQSCDSPSMLNESTENHTASITEIRTPNTSDASTSSFSKTKNQSFSAHPEGSKGDNNFSSSYSDSSTSSNVTDPDTGVKEESSRTSRLKKAGQALTLSYAQTKQFQQFKTSSNKSEKKNLTLGHAQAKSRLMTTHQNKKLLRADSTNMKSLQKESYDFMIGVMDECTHLGNFSVPVDPELIIIVSAKQDAYVPRDGVLGLDELWPGCEVRDIDQGHVGAVVLHQAAFRKAVKDSFDKQIRRYFPDHVPKARTQQYFFKSSKLS